MEQHRGSFKDELVSVTKKKNKTNEEDENKEEDQENFDNEIERITEFYTENVEKLKEDIDNERDKEKEDFLNDIKNKEYYRNRQRIEDINDVHDFWEEKIMKEVKRIQNESKITKTYNINSKI